MFAVRVLCAVMLLGIVSAGDPWYVSDNINNIYSRCVSATKCDNGVTPFGKVSSIKACEAKASDTKFTSFTWHHPNFSQGSEYASHCYGISDGKWTGQHQMKVDSGTHTKPPPPTPPPAPGTCKIMADCAYNGACTNGKCVCAPQFMGDKCDRFNFEPLDPSKGTGYQTIDKTGDQVSSWGGSVLLADDGKFHMWAAEMSGSVGIKAWITNSQVIHAVADQPIKPQSFTRKEVVAPVFAHEPTVARAPSGEYVMFYTTNYGETPGSQCGPPCDCGHNGTSCLSCPNDQQCSAEPRSPLSTRMSYSNSTDGPWSTPVLVPFDGGGDTNLACVIRKNSSLVCLGRPGIGMLYADNWRDVKTYGWHHFEGSIRGEDPMVWSTEVPARAVYGNGLSGPAATVEVLHAVTHGGGWGDPFGFHYWSTDGGFTWSGTNNKVYENIVEMKDGSTHKILSRRERPHVVLDGKGNLIALTNGVTEAWPCTLQQEPDRPACKHPPVPGVNPDCGPGSNGTSIWCPVDYCYTLWQSLKQY
jgi:hypothetical protein